MVSLRLHIYAFGFNCFFTSSSIYQNYKINYIALLATNMPCYTFYMYSLAVQN